MAPEGYARRSRAGPKPRLTVRSVGGATLDRHAVHMVWGRGRTSGTARRLRSAWLGLALVLVAALSAAAAQAAPARVSSPNDIALTPSAGTTVASTVTIGVDVTN